MDSNQKQARISPSDEEMRECITKGKSCEYGICSECPVVTGITWSVWKTLNLKSKKGDC